MKNDKNAMIIEGISKGDELILTDFYQQNIPYVRSYVIQNSGREEDVEDVFQDALLLIYQKLQKGSLEIRCTVLTYFLGVCKNLWRNRLRKKKKLILNTELIKTQDHSINDSHIDNIINKEQQNLYQKHFLKLDESNKRVLTLFFEGKSMREIAALMGYTEGYTRKKKFEAKKLLLEMIERDPIYFEFKNQASTENILSFQSNNTPEMNFALNMSK